MLKGKIKECIINHKNWLVPLIAMLIIFLVIGIIVYATSFNDEYAVEVKDDGAGNIAQNGETSITKKIVEDDTSSTKSLTYEVEINNFRKISIPTEITVLIDNSRSMGINDDESQIKTKAVQFVENLYATTSNTTIAVVTNSGVSYARNNLNSENIRNAAITAINNTTQVTATSLTSGIDYANSTFSNNKTDKFLIIFSDATDSILEEIRNVKEGKNINIFSILTDITNNEYQDNADIMGSAQMISDINDFSSIYNEITRSIKNVKVTDIFTEEVNEYFDFEVISKDNNMEFNKTEEGYTLNIPSIKANETKTFKFRLTLKENANIDSAKIYRELHTSNSLTVEYGGEEDTKESYEMTVSPTFVICKKYSLTIQAVSEKSDQLPVTNLDVKVVGTVVGPDDTIKEIYNKTLKTDSNGEIKIEDLKTLGDITFEIKPIVDQLGYSETDATQIIVHNDPKGVGTIWAESDTTTPEVDVVKRNITVKLPIKVQVFNIKVDVTESNNTNVKLGNIEFRLIQPKLNSKYEMEALYGTTDENGNLTFKPTVMTKDGTYEYILSQMTEQEGYDGMGNVTLRVTFKDGKLTAFTHKYNDSVVSRYVSEIEGNVSVGNVAQKDDTFKLEINVVDADNSNIKLEGAIYDVELTRVTSGGEQIINTMRGNITDENGKIALELPGKGNIRVRITEVKAKPGYELDKGTKEIVFVRSEGTVQYITAKNPIEIDAIADSDANALVVNLTNKAKTEQNRVQVHLVDNLERDINIPGALIAITRVGETVTYKELTDENGIANFIIADEKAGTYPYEIELLSGIPYGYINSSIHLGTISISFDDNGYTYEVGDIETTVPYFETRYGLDTENEFTYHTAYINVGLEPDNANTYNFQIKLVDEETKNIAIEGAKYNITIESGEIVRKITGRATDKNGMITTRLVGQDNITITVEQTESIKGYVANNQTQIIELTKIADSYQITNQEPYVYDPANNAYMGAEVNGNNVIYHDNNKAKTGDDTRLNLFINKKDTNDNLVEAVKTVLTSSTLKYPNEEALNINYIETDDNGYFEIIGIKVNGNDLKNGERIDYIDMYEVDVDGEKKANTDIKLKLIFRYNEEKQIIQITNVEVTWGNRLIAKKEFSGYESELAYESNVYLDIYTNYDDVGNFSLDLNKVNKDGNNLPGAKYDVTVTRPDGTRLIRRDLEVSDKVEFSGFFVSVGTKIEITEKEAPIGYAVNEYTEVLEITEIDPATGDIKVELEESNYEIPRAEIDGEPEILILGDGSYKTCVKLNLVDYELATFKFGINAKDSKTNKPIEGYKFKISSDQGAQANTEATNKEGRVSALVGSNYAIENYVVTYKIETLKAADFYKKLSKPVEVKVVFDLNGEVVGNLTEQVNSIAEGYGTTWSIEATNTIDGNDIDIILNIETEDPLVVNTMSIDTISGVTLNNVEYKIEPSLNIPGTGTTKIEVGYVLPNGIQTYTLKQTNLIDNYVQLTDKQFKVTYNENGDIETVESLSEGITVVTFEGKEITIKVDMEPGVPFVITNKGYFDDLTLLNAKFEITSAQEIAKESTTDANGIAIGYIDKFGTDEVVRYTIKQTKATTGYATVDEFQIDVTFDENRNITNAVLASEVNKENIEFVKVTHKTPSVSTDIGYNNNDKGLVQLLIRNYPEVTFDIENVHRQDENIKLPGTVYEVTSTINTKDTGITTNEQGIGTAHMDRSEFGKTVQYTIKEISPSVRYQTLGIEAIIDVDFDNEGYITEVRVTKREDVTKAELPAYVEILDKFKVNIQIKSNPELAIAINKVDKDTNEPVAKVDFEITARISKEKLTEEEIEKLTLNTSEITEEQYLSQVLDRLKIDIEDVEIIRQNIGLNKLIADLKANNKLTVEEEDEINSSVNNSIKINKIIELGKATKTQINQIISKVTYQEIVDSLIEKGTTSQDRVNELLQTLKNLVRLDVDNVTTNAEGQATAYMDKGLANKTIEYTIKETRKADGYDWLDEVIILEIEYDSTGKIVEEDGVKVISGDINIPKENINVDQFTINPTITNKPSDDLRIHLTVEDVYDSNKKLETASFDAFLVDTTEQISFRPDDKYRVNLASGSVTSTTGNVTAHGEDTESMGIYEEGVSNRILRLVQKGTPDTYFIGNNEYKSGYQSIAYALLVNVSFDDEGKITDTSLYNPGGDSNSIGYIADERYVQVSHTRNTINVTVRYYPMLQVQMQTVDMYTGESLQASYGISTTQWGYQTSQQHVVKSGWINPYYNSWMNFGDPYEISYTTNEELDSIDNAERVKMAPTEADNNSRNIDEKERILYIYEKAEPTAPIQYQTYLPRYIAHPYEKLLARIKVYYDELGQIDNVEVLETKSSNNIKDNYFTLVEATVNEHTIQITVKYAPITTITATVVDEISGKGLGGIYIKPYINRSYLTNQSYEYRTTDYYTTGTSGVTGWTYWGASVNNSLNRYELDTYTQGSGYDGYLDPGSIILDVTYDEYGRVASAIPRSTDQFGDINAVNITWENNDIKVTIPYSRRFNVKLNKVDYYDSNTILNANFKVISTENANVDVASSTMTAIGKVYAGKTVKYTLSETVIPSGYIPITNMDIYVTFNNDGTVRNTTSNSEYYEFIKSATADTNVNRVNKVDLEANIKNKPRFDVTIDLSDKFYPSLKLEGGMFSMTNSKGDTSLGIESTDKNGILQTFVGPIYPNEEVTYTIRQTNTINGYYENDDVIEFKVKFNENAKIEEYVVLQGKETATIEAEKYVNKTGVTIGVVNMPKDVKVGIYKYDKLDERVMGNVKFNINTEVVGENTVDTEVITNDNGTIVGVADNFVERSNYRTVIYTISEIEVPNTYRKIQDVIIQVTYYKDGSMYLYDVLSNESNVGVEVATNKQIKFINEMPVHIKLTIPNDNAYDLIVKNEDTNYEGLGVEGTVYDVSINGIEQEPLTTDKNGIAKIINQTQKGDITIRIAERQIGEGYRADNNNETTIVVHKGEEEYTLKEISNSNELHANVVVDEEHGTVTVTFKNETKLELNILNDDINTGKVLGETVYEITEKEIDSNGNAIAGTLRTITTDDNNTTNESGILYFDLGTAKQNTIVEYTVTQIAPPTSTETEIYTTILPIKVKVTFDVYGRITNIEDDSFRVECFLDSDTGKSHNMIFNIGNGFLDPAYTVKIISADSQTGNRLNGSIFQVEALDENGESYKSATGVTTSISKVINGKTYIVENGVMKVTGIKAENNVTIAVNQVETLTGYTYGSNKVSGNVIVNAKFTITSENLEKDLELSKVDDGGFEVTVDNTNREIVIKVKNDPVLTFDITKVDANTKEKLENVKFSVTSVIQTSTTTVETDLNEIAKATDEKGHTELNGGMILAGKTVIYTLKEEKIDDYDKLDDIILLVQYDTKGNIMHYEILSDVDNVRIKDGAEGIITKTKRTLAESYMPGIVEAYYHQIQIPTGTGTKILQLEINNYKTPLDRDYQVVIEKHHEQDPDYPYCIPGVTFEITVTQEYGKRTTTWVDKTNADGKIISPFFSGYGYITIEITELSGPDNYKIDTTTKTIRLYREKDSHKLRIVSSDVGYELNNDFTQIMLKPVNVEAEGMYDIVISKVNKLNSVLIANNPANIEVIAIEEYEIDTEITNEETGEITYDKQTEEIKSVIISEDTDEKGRIVQDGIKMPENPGTYKYIIKENRAPEGYNKLTGEAQIEVTFDKNIEDEMIIKGAKVISGEGVKIAKVADQLLSIVIENENRDDIIQDGEFTFDITKVDNANNAITTDKAIFKVTDMQTKQVSYFETNEYGKLDMQKISIPNLEGTYTYILNEVKAPEGYALDRRDIKVTLEIKQNSEGKFYIEKITVDGENIVYKNPSEDGETVDTRISIDVINEKGQNGNVNTKPYTLILNKIDSLTKEHIKDRVEFEISLVNGEIVHAATNENGQIVIENVHMPSNADEYEIIIKELSTPEGYKEDLSMKVLKVTFEGEGENMTISNITIDEENGKGIEILEESAEDKIVLNVLNEKEKSDSEKLYVISRKDKDQNDIYEVEQERYEGSHYTIDKPFIDTKVAKYGSNMTAEEFIDNLESNGVMTVLDKDGKQLESTQRVKTGMILKSTLEDQELTFIIIVKGDVDGDGRVRTLDLDLLIDHIKGDKITDQIKLRALDLDLDGRIRTTDLNEFYEVIARG